ncbi:MAG: 5-methylcytosine restriction system specificity protein McrC [Candidatus Woesearchaeota archaeon]
MTNSIKISSPNTVYIDDKDLNQVRELLKKFDLIETLDKNQWNIPQGIIGQLITDNVKIVIQPKIYYLNINDYLRLITSENEVKSDSFGTQDLGSTQELSELIITSFLTILKKLSKEGIPIQYKKIKTYKDYFIGNVNISDTFLRYCLNQKPIVKTQVENLDIDFFEARVIKSAYNKILSISKKYRNPLITATLSNIRPLNHKIENTSSVLRENKRNKTLIKAYHLAIFILNNLDTTRVGNNYSISFLFNGNKLFENFVTNLILSYFSRDDFFSQYEITAALNLNTNSSIKIRPDIYLKSPKPIILDVKNKNYDDAIANEDYHQMVSYMNAFDTNTSALIYPYHKNYSKQIYKIYSDSKSRIYKIPIDIRNRQYQTFLDSISEIIQFG